MCVNVSEQRLSDNWFLKLSYLQLKLRPLFPKSTNVFFLSFEHLQPPEALKTSEEVGTSQKSLSISILDNQIFRDLSVTFFFVLMMETCREKEGGWWHLGKGHSRIRTRVIMLRTWAPPSQTEPSSPCSPPPPRPPPLWLTERSSEGHREINELIADSGNVCDTAAFLSPSSCNDHHFLLSTQPLTLTAGYSESVWRTYLPFTPIFLAALPSLIPVVRWKPHYSKFEIHGGFGDKAQAAVGLQNEGSLCSRKGEFQSLQTYRENNKNFKKEPTALNQLNPDVKPFTCRKGFQIVKRYKWL